MLKVIVLHNVFVVKLSCQFYFLLDELHLPLDVHFFVVRVKQFNCFLFTFWILGKFYLRKGTNTESLGDRVLVKGVLSRLFGVRIFFAFHNQVRNLRLSNCLAELAITRIVGMFTQNLSVDRDISGAGLLLSDVGDSLLISESSLLSNDWDFTSLNVGD